MYKFITGQIKKGYKITEEFTPSKGLLQRCFMSPTLFKIYMNVALKEWTKKCEKMGVQLMNENYLFHLLFVDNQMITAQDEYNIDKMMRKLLDTCRE